MSKTSFGKLAIGVVALSSSLLVHADIRDTLAGTQGGFEFAVGGLKGLAPLQKEFGEFFHLGQMTGPAAFRFATPSLFSRGAVDVKGILNIGYLAGGESFHISAAEKVKKEAKSATQALGDHEKGTSSSGATLDPANVSIDARPSTEVTGGILSAGTKMTYAFNNGVKVIGGVELGALLPQSKPLNFCFLGTAKGGIGYNINESHAIEGTFNYTGFLDQSIKNVTGFKLGYNYTI